MLKSLVRLKQMIMSWKRVWLLMLNWLTGRQTAGSALFTFLPRRSITLSCLYTKDEASALLAQLIFSKIGNGETASLVMSRANKICLIYNWINMKLLSVCKIFPLSCIGHTFENIILTTQTSLHLVLDSLLNLSVFIHLIYLECCCQWCKVTKYLYFTWVALAHFHFMLLYTSTPLHIKSKSPGK